jgi:hypothetical protein
MVVLSLPALLFGILGAFGAMSDLAVSLSERHTAIARLSRIGAESVQFSQAFTSLPRPEAERLALLLGDERFERRGVTIPMAGLTLLLCWLLITGALGTLRRQPFGVPLFSWAALVNIPFAGLGLLVLTVRSREITSALGQVVAEAMSAVTRRTPEAELAEIWLYQRQAVRSFEVLCALWCLFLTGTTLYLRRHLPPAPPDPPPSERYSDLT